MKSYSRPNNFPHNININEKGLIKCDSICPRYNADGFCSHAISLQTKSLEKYACVLPKCEERNTTAIVSQKIDIKKVNCKSVARSRKKHIGSSEKEVRVSIPNNVFINPNESLAISSRIMEGIQRLPVPMVTFLDEFIGGTFQGMLNADAASPPHDLIQFFNRELDNLNDETVLTVLAKCEAMVAVCYGCSLNFKRNGQGPLAPFDFIIVKTLRREFYNQEMKCLSAPSNFHAFCDNPFYQPFECIQHKYLTFNVGHMKIHNSIIGFLTPQHLVILRNFQLF